MRSYPHPPAAGFTLVEALIAMLVMAFGMLAVAGFQTSLSHNSDVAKQRTEATRLAQAKIEELRAFQQLDPATGIAAWADIASASDVPATTTNTSYARTWTVTDDAALTQKTVRVSVDWVDRQGTGQRVALLSVISSSDPAGAGSLAVPPAAEQAKKPSYGMPPIPLAGKYLGGGKSAISLPGGSQYVVFDANSDLIIAKCTGAVTASLTAATACSTPFSALLVTGFISGLPTAFDNVVQASATGLSLVPAGGAAAPPECFVARVPNDGNYPRDPGSPAPTAFLTSYYTYACLIEPAGSGSWSGSLQVVALAGSLMQAGDRICRLSWDQGDAGSTAGDSTQEHPDPYAAVRETLESQNFVYWPVTEATNCPGNATVNGIAVSYALVNTIAGP